MDGDGGAEIGVGQEIVGNQEKSLICTYPDGIKPEDLRDKEKVDPAKYDTDLIADLDGSGVQKTDEQGRPKFKKVGLVNKNQEGVRGVANQEKAQAIAYGELSQKIEAGLVRPDLIGAEMVDRLGVGPGLENAPEKYEGITPVIASEIDALVSREAHEISASGEKGLITHEERDLIIAEVEEFAALYGKAYGTGDVRKAFEVCRDNARKLAYQVIRDKEVFSGSDHGTRHILEGNLKFAKQMIPDLRKNGINVSAVDEVLIHQVIIDHDLGYTEGVAQAGTAYGLKGFEASKDHPLFSAKFIEANKGYYVDKFGESGYGAIIVSVLNHSYPRLEYESAPDDGVHKQLIRSITSTVDSLGVTVETKTPAFFWNPDALRTLLKIRVAMEASSSGKVDPALMQDYKEELITIASRETIPQRRDGYINAITNFFNEFTAETTLGHFTGVVRRVSVDKAPAEPGSEGKLRVTIQMTPSEVFALLGDMFGDKDAIKSFAKAMGDLGISKDGLEKYVREFRKNRRNKKDTENFIKTREGSQTDIMAVIEGMTLEEQCKLGQAEDVKESGYIGDIASLFAEVDSILVRSELRQLLHPENGELTSADVFEIGQRFIEMFGTQQLTQLEYDQLTAAMDGLISGSDLEKAAIREQLDKFTTQKEREFMQPDVLKIS